MKKTQIITTVFEYDSVDELPLEEQELVKNAKEAALRSYSPYSKFSVGAAILLENDEIIQGNNQENSAYPSGLCAERVAMFYANSKFPDSAVKAIAVTARTNGSFSGNPIPPCGSCRQVLLETEERFNQPIKLILYGEKKIRIVETVKEMLPLYFEKEMLDE
ncbi:cytidine deaminase [Labilibaculum sp. A4]|uniref:Cytidine deaminase n=1 Tax=Labilibaculum euxinus TaxID=2686357 RepID=A0A425YE20_9BACT|nr:cytidine deaminase [Labilibaculum euxinus]MDQ1770958.1 cytidine deaminase [Labilibaculum euxinus]MUP38854.1 cytidine deaminase [Labilibaculum euxinus]MVB08059.1 cytidine deaminase [Labilibaculum euxinus]MWN76127.1 cytidine deaminase [Labilibaculum euxinus]